MALYNFEPEITTVTDVARVKGTQYRKGMFVLIDNCESGPIAACLFLLSVLSFVSYSKRKVIEWNEMF